MEIKIETQGDEPSGNPVTVKKFAISDAPSGGTASPDCLDGGRGEREIFLIIRDYEERKPIVF
jgi:hypothetical protein